MTATGVCVGGFGAGLLGIMPLICGLLMAVVTGGPRGIGGGARGFSKLLSWFWGNRGLWGGEMIEVPCCWKGLELTPLVGVVPPG
jgi:hypothetical protein